MINQNSLLALFNSIHSYRYEDIHSPIEEILINHLIKFLHNETKLIIQYPISTISGEFKADAALIRGENIVIIECDGAEYHTNSRDEMYDEWRDTLILIEKKAKAIYRVKGIDIKYNLYKVFFIIYSFDELFFNRSYAKRIPKFDILENDGQKRIHYDYYVEIDHIKPSVVEVDRKDLKNGFNRDWFKFILYSLLYRDAKVKKLLRIMSIKQFDSQQLIRMLNEKHPNMNLESEDQLLGMHLFKHVNLVLLNNELSYFHFSRNG